MGAPKNKGKQQPAQSIANGAKINKTSSNNQKQKQKEGVQQSKDLESGQRRQDKENPAEDYRMTLACEHPIAADLPMDTARFQQQMKKQIEQSGIEVEQGTLDKTIFESPKGKKGGRNQFDNLVEQYLRGKLKKRKSEVSRSKGRIVSLSQIEFEPKVTKMLQLQGEEFLAQLKLHHAHSQGLLPLAPQVYRGRWDDFDKSQLYSQQDYTHVKYTPIASVDPRDFKLDGYKLRLQEQGRNIEMLICVTLYNEDFQELKTTLLGIYENLNYLMGDRGGINHAKKTLDWSRVAVCIVQDGLPKCHSTVLAYGEAHGFYLASALQDKNNLGEATRAHLFEYTIRQPTEDEGFYPPLQVIFLSKAENSGKISSHAWFFNGICQQLDPKYTFLFDAGTRAYPSAMYYIYKYFLQYDDVGGCGGELQVVKPGCNLLGRVQYLEWKFAYIFEIPLQHIAGYIQVLPGAFSAYRWKAIQGEPLHSYFRGYYEQHKLTPFLKNVFLAEDRILCIEIVTKSKCKYILAYVKQAKASADFVSTLPGLMKQRRRWLNGSFFAALYSLGRFSQIWKRTQHSFGRKILLTLEFMYLAYNLVVSNLLGVGFMFTFIKELIDQTFASITSTQWQQQLGDGVIAIYCSFLLIQLVINIKTQPQNARRYHLASSVAFGLFQILFLILTIWFLVRDQKTNHAQDLLGGFTLSSLSVMTMIGFSILVVTVHGDLIPLITTGLQYWFMTGTYVNILQVYSFTNTHDVSWGTKGLLSQASNEKEVGMSEQDIVQSRRADIKNYFKARQLLESDMLTSEELQSKQESIEQQYNMFSNHIILIWLFSNGILLFIISKLSDIVVCTSVKILGQCPPESQKQLGDYYLQAFFIGISLLRALQLLISVIYIIIHYGSRRVWGKEKQKISKKKPKKEESTAEEREGLSQAQK